MSGLVFLAGCSGTDDAAPDLSTGGDTALGGGASVGGRESTGGAAQAGGRTAVGGAANVGGVRSTGGVPSTSAIAQACASDCAILSQTTLDCVPSPCATACESRYDSVAGNASCQAAYLSLLQCGTTQPATNWSCYDFVIAAPTKGCDAQISALGQDATCLLLLALGH